jgi:hypothetical protein
MKLAHLLLTGALVLGCSRRTVVTTWPGGVIQVVDDDGAPIAGATIALQRKIGNPSPASMGIGGPGGRPLTTDSKGEVVTIKETAVFDPGFLLPGDPPQVYFEACISAPGHLSRYTLLGSGDVPRQTISLRTGSGSCDPHMPSFPPPRGHVTVASIEKTGDRWNLMVGIRPDTKLNERATLTYGGATLVVETVVRGAISYEIQRVDIVATGDGAKINADDKLAITNP